MRFLIFIAFTLISHRSTAGCVQLSEETVAGDFEVVSVEGVRVRCVLDSNGIIATKKSDVKVPGCKVSLVDKKTQKQYSVYDGECNLNEGKILKSSLSTVKNMCCGVKSQFGKLRPLCTKDKEAKLVQELNESEKICLGGFAWAIFKEGSR